MSDDTITDLDAALAALETPTEDTTHDTEIQDTPDDDVIEAKDDAEPEASQAEDDDEDMEARVRRLHIEAREAKRAAQQAQRDAEVARGQRQLPRDEAVLHEAAALAQQIAKAEAWNTTCNKIGDAGKAEFKDFDTVIDSYKQNFPEWGGVPAPLVEGAVEVMPGKEHVLLAHLSRNLDIAEHILSLSPVKAGAAMAKLADKLAKKPSVSQAPKPIKSVAGNSGNTNRQGYYEGMSEAAFFKMEEKARRDRGY